MGFFDKTWKISLTDLLKLILISLAAGIAIYILSSAVGWILLMAATFLGIYSLSEVYQDFKKGRQTKKEEDKK